MIFKLLCANLAIGICGNPTKMIKQVGDGNQDNSRDFHIHKWNLKVIAEGQRLSFSGGWVTVLVIPPFL